MSYTIRMWDAADLIRKALELPEDPHPCSGGPWCPRCRLAIAKGKLDDEFKVSMFAGDGTLEWAACHFPKKQGWTREESDAELRRLLEKVEGAEPDRPNL